MKKYYRHLLLFAAGLGVFALLSCSVTHIADGSSSETVIGLIVNETNQPAPGTRVTLYPAQYNPVTASASTMLPSDTTDANGRYSLPVPDPGKQYTIQAVHIAERTRAMISRITIAGDTTIASTGTLLAPGTIKLLVPDSADTVNGYVYIPGSGMAEYLADAGGSVILDSVPAGAVPMLKYGIKNSTVQKELHHDFLVSPGDTVVLWKHSRRIILNTSATGAQITGNILAFPLLIRLDGGNFDFKQVKPAGDDIRFSKNNGALLPHEIELWDAGASRASVWVRVDTVFGNNDVQSILMTWGNASAVSTSNGAAVFDTANAYNAVWHLNQGCNDATANSHNGTNFGTVDTAGIVGNAKKFSGNDSIRIAGLAGTPASLTLSAWANLEQAADSGAEVVSIGNAVLLRMDDTRFNHTYGPMASYRANTTHYDFVYRQYLAKTGWHHLAFTVDNTTYKKYFYVDGVLRDSGTIAYPISYSGVGQNTFIGIHGNEKDDVYDFTGLIDEVRFCRVAHSADYIKLCYMNQKRDGALVIFK